MPRSTPLVSVVMPVHNAVDHVEESVHSVLTQTVEDFELIAVDGGSTDGSREAVQAVADPRVRLVEACEGREGAVRNVGLREARGEFLVWQDAADAALPQRLERLLAAFAPGVGFTHHDAVLVDEDGSPTGYQRSTNPRTELLAQYLLREGAPFSCQTSMLRRSAVGDLQHAEDLLTGVDVDFMRRFAPTTSGVLVPEPLSLHREHPSSDQTDTPAYLERLLAQVPLLELVTDAQQDDWSDDAQIVALAFVGLCLLRRGLTRGADLLEEAATAGLRSRIAVPAVTAMLELAGQAPLRALDQLTNGADNSMIHILRGNAYAGAADLPAAAAEYRRALSLRPESYDALEGLRSVSEEMFVWELDDPARRLVRRFL